MTLAAAVLRLAVPADGPQVARLMRASVLDLFPAFYSARQTVSAAAHIAHLDEQLVLDGTYYVHEEDGEIVACGGWSRRDKLFTGSGPSASDDRLLDPATEPARVRAMFVRSDRTGRGLGRRILQACETDAAAAGFASLTLMATLPGEQLYRANGFLEVARVELTMPDGVTLDAVEMHRPIRTAASGG